jgi:hypothetical protein
LVFGFFGWGVFGVVVVCLVAFGYFVCVFANVVLQDNLGGNSRTVMVATISPASDNYVRAGILGFIFVYFD